MNNQQKILCLTSSYANSLDSRNHVVHVENSELAKAGFIVKAITHHVRNTPTIEVMDSVFIKRYKYLPDKYEFDTSSIADTIYHSKKNQLKALFMIASFFTTTFIECIREKPDVIIAHWAFPPGFIAFMISKFFRIKYLVSSHGTEVISLKKFGILKKLTKKILNNASLVIVNSNFTKKEFIKAGVKHEKMRIIYGPPNYVQHFTNEKLLKEFRTKFTSPSNKIILFVGRLFEVKGVEYLIRSLPEMKNSNVHLIIAGDGILLNELKNLVKSLDLENKVTFFGHANYKQLGLLYDISDIVVLPSIIDSMGGTESLGLVTLEAMESHLPVIGSAVGGIVEVIKHEESGLLVKPKDPKSIADAIDRLLSDEELKQKLIENSQETLKDFSTKITAEKYINAIKYVLDL